VRGELTDDAGHLRRRHFVIHLDPVALSEQFTRPRIHGRTFHRGSTDIYAECFHIRDFDFNRAAPRLAIRACDKLRLPDFFAARNVRGVNR